MLEKINAADINTHMPYLTCDASSGEEILLYCRSGIEDVEPGSQTRRWKLWVVTENSEPRRINTRLGERVTECAPTAWQDDDGWHVTFIAGCGQDRIPYQLYRMWGETLDDLSFPIPVCRAEWGFIWTGRTVTGQFTNIVEIRHPGTFNMDLELPGAFLGRISYQSQNPDRLIIGCQWQMESEQLTLEYDISTGDQSILMCDGQAAYKCSILGDTVLYAKCGGRFADDRTICKAKVFQRLTFKGILRRMPGSVAPDIYSGKRLGSGSCGCYGKVDLGPTTRPSCLECTEKHIGAAFVLLGEERDGYAHRLRAIGHLHEGEDESQAWPVLHNLIRRARKGYQQQGTMPLWDHLADKIAEQRSAIEETK